MTVVEELTRIIRLRQQRGIHTAELSPANRQVLGCRPRPAAATPPPPVAMPSPAQRQAALRRFTEATASAVPPTPAFPQTTLPQDGPFPPPPDVSNATWEQLRENCRHCASCRLAALRQKVVIEDGLPAAPLMFIGEGPGADEDAQGKPFVGRAGQLLTAMIKAMGRDRTSTLPETAVYIANIVKCRPPNNRNPFPDEEKACIGYLLRQIALVHPKVIVLLGNVPLQALFGKGGITRLRGTWLQLGDIPVMPTFHPAYLLRFERYPADFIANKRLVWQDLQKVMARLKALS